jgi:bidirectional [NiFe] hydrogenase diaphorase subunit
MNIDELRDTAEETREQETRYRHVVRVCVAAGCLSCHSDMLLENLQAQIKERGMEGETLAKGVGCLGPCSEGPVVVVEREAWCMRA